MNRLCVYALTGLLLAPLSTLQAQDAESRLQQLVTDLNKQIQRAEQERLADPWFLRDLQKIVSNYENPWQTQTLFDDFSARGPAPARPWQVEAGEFLIDWRYGLRSVVAPGATQTSSTKGSSSNGKEDLAAALLGAFLEQALEGKNGGSQEADSNRHPTKASVSASVAISNAFNIDFQFSNRDVNGQKTAHLSFGPYQRAANRAGYRLHYYNGSATGEPSLSLNRLNSRGGESILDLYSKPLNLIDGQMHELRWSRDRQGTMQVSLDGQLLISVRDQSFRDNFDGLVIENLAGDFAVRKIDVRGAP